VRAQELRAILDRRPFEPIRLHISSGQTVDIKHPEMAFVTRSLVVIGVTESDDDQVADYAVHYNLLHVVKIEPLNGHKPKRRTKRQ
jgi:hypothetical protein